MPDEQNPSDSLRYAKQLMRGRGGVERHFEQAVYYFDLAAQAGDVDAMYWLGKCYWRGVGCLRDTSGAMSCFENAANRGHVAAARKLAQCFAEGLHVPRCESLAAYWELKAAQLDSAAPPQSRD
ncbi:MAG: hypothetical protein R3Y56_08100 [Akkermansia sp.]